jgi:transposase-like protein
LEERLVYLDLDAIYPKVRSGGKVVSLPVLVALGVNFAYADQLERWKSARSAGDDDVWTTALNQLAAEKFVLATAA